MPRYDVEILSNKAGYLVCSVLILGPHSGPLLPRAAGRRGILKILFARRALLITGEGGCVYGLVAVTDKEKVKI